MSEQKIQYPENFKLLIRESCLTIITKKIEDITLAIQTTREGMQNETKSSAGDKHETSRAMMQIDIEQYQTQLQKVRNTEIEIQNISSNISNGESKKGSLITTNHGIFYLGAGIGKLAIEGIDLIAISIQSPLGIQLLQKKEGDEFSFQEKSYQIIQLD